MADRADVVPLRRRGPDVPDPELRVVDVGDPARTLTVSWSTDRVATRLTVETAEGLPSEVVLTAEDVLRLARALIERLPGPAAPNTPLATVLPLRPLEPHEFSSDT